MAVVVGTANQDFIHVAGDGFGPFAGFIENATATAAADSITGAAQADIIMSGDGDDTVSGDDGNDTVTGGQGTDRLTGGAGNDVFRFLGVSDISGLAERINGGADIDALDFREHLASGAVDLTAAILSSIEHLVLRSNDVTLTSAQLGDFSIIEGSGFVDRLILSDGGLVDLAGATITNIDQFAGNALANTVRLNGVATGQRVDLFDGTDSLDGSDGGDIADGGTGADTLRGRAGNDSLRGDDDADLLDGGAGNDTLAGGGGVDNQTGGAGNDVFRYELPAEISGLAETISGGGDLDAIDFRTGGAFGAVDLTAANISGVEELYLGQGDFTLRAAQLSAFDRIDGSGFLERIFVSGGGVVDLTGATVFSIEEIRGSNGDNTILLTDVLNAQFVDARNGNDSVAGGLGADRLVGGFGNDTLFGSEGNDTIIGGQDTDLIQGGIGNDQILITGVSDVSGLAETIDGGNDTDTLNFSGATGSVDLSAATLIGVENLIFGDLSITLTAAQLSGFDVIFGSGFVESIRVSDSGVVDLTGTSITFVESIFANSGGSTFIFTGGTGVATFRGSAVADAMFAGTNNTAMFGEGGNDTLVGAEGSDNITGGLGTDSLTGGLNNDVFDFNDVVEIGRGATRDVITDFTHGADLIDLNTIDANTEVQGNQNFTFIEGAAFGNVAGELRYSGDILSGDVNGDGSADFQIRLVGTPVLTLSDLIL